MTPEPVDYQSWRLPPPRRGGIAWFIFGVISGMLISIVVWPSLGYLTQTQFAMPLGLTLMIALVFIPTLKGVVGVVVSRRLGKVTFLSGILTSIPLAPLLGIGFIYAACAGWI